MEVETDVVLISEESTSLYKIARSKPEIFPLESELLPTVHRAKWKPGDAAPPLRYSRFSGVCTIIVTARASPRGLTPLS